MRFDILRQSWNEVLGRGDSRRRSRGVAQARGRFEALEDRLLLTASPTRPAYAISTESQDQMAPAVGIAQNGDFVAAWTATVTDFVVTTPVTHTVPVFRRFAATGLAKDTTEVQAFNNLLDQSDLDVAVAPAGNFVLVWMDADSAADTDIFFAAYSADGTLQSGPTRVNTTDADTTNQVNPAVGIADNGDFVVSWTHLPTGGANNIYYRRFTAAGVAKDAADVAIPNVGSNAQSFSDVAVGSTGNTIITWTQAGPSFTNIFYEALRGTDGTAYIPVTQVSNASTGDLSNPSVGIDLRGYFDIAWADAISSTNHDIRVRRFTATGALRDGAEIVVASTTADETDPQIGVSVGQFVVAWQTDSGTQQTQSQLFGDNAIARQAVSTLAAPLATASSGVAMDAGGEFALTAEHTTAGTSSIDGVNYRNSDATPGLYDPLSALYSLRNTNTTGEADTVFAFSGGASTLVPITGDWNGNGVATVGFYDPTTSFFYLTDSTTSAVTTIPAFGFGAPGLGWVPVAGDWNNDGADDVGVYDPGASTFYLASNFSGGLFAVVGFGPAGAGWKPIAGDWNASHTGDKIGLYNPASSVFYLRNTLTTGIADLTVGFGPADGTQRPVTGDWTNSGIDTIGLYDPASSVFSLRNTNTSGFANLTVGFGPSFGGWLPLANHWQAATPGVNDTVGLYDPSGSTFYKRFSNTSGFANAMQAFGVANDTWKPLAGDWDYGGTTTIALFDPATTSFYLRDTNSTGPTTTSFTITGVPGDPLARLPVAGDWNGDGVVTVGVYDPNNSIFYLKNTNTTGPADITPFGFGAPGAGWQPIAGDWNGSGVASIGLYDPGTATFYLTTSTAGGSAEIVAGFGAPGWIPIAGDWNRDGTTTIGAYDPTTATCYLRNSNTTGTADVTFAYGSPGAGWLPIDGDWTGVGASPLMAAAVAAGALEAAPLADGQLARAANQAISQWEGVGLPGSMVEAMRRLQFRVADLPGTQLGLATADVIYVDRDAAGFGWFFAVDPSAVSQSGLATLDPTAVDHIDLASVVMHELGHTLGLGDLDNAAGSLMSGALPAGVRRLPGLAEVDAVMASGV